MWRLPPLGGEETSRTVSLLITFCQHGRLSTMSQKVRIVKVSIIGASPFLGLFDTGEFDTNGEAVRVKRWSRNPSDLMNWLSDGHRYRYNQLRSRRSKWSRTDAIDDDDNKVRGLVPIGITVDTRSEKETRATESFLTSIPARVLGHPEKNEKKEWFAAVARRKTLKAKGTEPGAMPGFRKRGQSDVKFGCWHSKGENAIYHRTGRKSGIVTITGMNSKVNSRPGENLGCAFTIRLHVRVSQPIREYTSVEVNWSKKTLVFVNAPVSLKDSAPTGAAVALDGGIIHAYTSSDNETFNLPLDKLKELENKVKHHQKRMAKSRVIAARESRNFWESKGYQFHKSAAARLNLQITNVRSDAWHKITTHLVKTYDFVFIEDLKLKNMTKSASGTLANPGKNVAQKRGLNRSLRLVGLGIGRAQLAYKAVANDKVFLAVRPHYSSQECSACDYTSKENRKSQAVFLCLKCGHTENADLNAANVLIKRGMRAWELLEQEKLESQNKAGQALAGSKRKTEKQAVAATLASGSRKRPAAAALNREPARV